MLPSLDDALAALYARAVSGLSGPVPPQIPRGELTRSPAAMLVAQHAARSGLFLFHYEQRAQLELPEDWVPKGDAGLVEPPTWAGGVLLEHKYHSFRHELPLGSYHPGHRAKWSTHELCHGLVGGGWRPGATPLFTATAGRLAEIVPVTLYYFFDEAFLTRCPEHQGGGALFRTLCPACEALAATHLDDAEARGHIAGGLRYLDRELAAVARTRREGRPIGHQWASIDLCSDGLAYATAHGPRLQSEAWATYAERFLVRGAGWFDELDALEERVLAVAGALLGHELAPHTATPEDGRWLWALQDVGWRLSTVLYQTDGDAEQELERIVEELAGCVAAPATDGPAGLERALTAYTALCEDVFVPEPDEVFGVGYALPGGAGLGRGLVTQGVVSGLPLTADALGERLDAEIVRFAASDTWGRQLLPDRFAAYLADKEPALAELAAFEAAVCALKGRDPLVASLGDAPGPMRLSSHVRLLRAERDVIAGVDAVESGAAVWAQGERGLTLVDARGEALASEPTALLVGVDPQGETLLLDVPLEAADALEAGEVRADDPTLFTLSELGVLVPVAWPL